MPLISACNLRIQRASFAASEHAIYSASVLDVATTLCLVDFQEIAPPYSRNTYPEVDFRESTSPAQSESVNPVIPVVVGPPVAILKCWIFLTFKGNTDIDCFS